jgi:hypothetical protein
MAKTRVTVFLEKEEKQAVKKLAKQLAEKQQVEKIAMSSYIGRVLREHLYSHISN